MSIKIPDIHLFTQPRQKNSDVLRSTSSSKFRNNSFDSYSYSSSASNFNRPRSYKWDKISSTSDYYLQAMKILSNTRQYSSKGSTFDLFGTWKSKDKVKQNTKVFFPQNLYQYTGNKGLKKCALSKNELIDSKENNINLSPSKKNNNSPNHKNNPINKCIIKSFPEPFKVMNTEATPRFYQNQIMANNPNIQSQKTLMPNLLCQQNNLIYPNHIGSTPMLNKNDSLQNFSSQKIIYGSNSTNGNNPQIKVNFCQRPMNESANYCNNIEPQSNYSNLLRPFVNEGQKMKRPISVNSHSQPNIMLNPVINHTFNQFTPRNNKNIELNKHEKKLGQQNSPISKISGLNFQTQTDNSNQKVFYSSITSSNIKINNQLNKMESTLSSVEFKTMNSSQLQKSISEVQAHILLDQLGDIKKQNLELGSYYISKIDDIINRYDDQKEKSLRSKMTKQSFGKNKKKIQVTTNLEDKLTQKIVSFIDFS